MLRLMLLRHAEALSKTPAGADHERPLSKAGREAAALMGRYARAQEFAPKLVLTSPAQRARDTTELFVAGLDGDTPVDSVEALYDFGDGRSLLEVARRHGGQADPLMLVGHNPAMETLARKLVRSGDKDMIADLQRRFPAAALAVIDFEMDSWEELGPSAGELVVFVTPQALHEAQ